jgi:hypothetical protein
MAGQQGFSDRQKTAIAAAGLAGMSAPEIVDAAGHGELAGIDDVFRVSESTVRHIVLEARQDGAVEGDAPARTSGIVEAAEREAIRLLELVRREREVVEQAPPGKADLRRASELMGVVRQALGLAKAMSQRTPAAADRKTMAQLIAAERARNGDHTDGWLDELVERQGAEEPDRERAAAGTNGDAAQ